MKDAVLLELASRREQEVEGSAEMCIEGSEEAKIYNAVAQGRDTEKVSVK